VERGKFLRCASMGPRPTGETAMAAPDSLLKLLVSSFTTNVASWLLHTPVRAAHPVNVVLPTPTLTVDQVLHVTLATRHEGLLHLEFQGRHSHDAMRWRMQEYINGRTLTDRRSATGATVFTAPAGARTGRRVPSGSRRHPAAVTPGAVRTHPRGGPELRGGGGPHDPGTVERPDRECADAGGGLGAVSPGDDGSHIALLPAARWRIRRDEPGCRREHPTSDHGSLP